MNRRLYVNQERIGAVFSLLLAVFLWQIYNLTSGNPIGILFGAVNQSIWEQLKCVILGYVIFGLTELVTSKPYFRQFTVSKAVGLYSAIILYIILRYFLWGIYNTYVNLAITAAALIGGYIVSVIVMGFGERVRDLFTVSCFMLILVFVMYFSFTIFPPHLALFQDPDTSLYGIIPDYIDTGAMVMDILAG